MPEGNHVHVSKKVLSLCRRHRAKHHTLISRLSKRQARRPDTKGRATRRNPATSAYPSFVGLRPASQASSHSKRANKSRGTKQEVMLQRALRRLGLNFRCNVDSLPGKPDIVFSTEKVAVFCDGDFWHGRDWSVLKRKIAKVHNAHYWRAKIARNIRRDKESIVTLHNEGWRVIRFWESDIQRRSKKMAERIHKTLKGRKWQ